MERGAGEPMLGDVRRVAPVVHIDVVDAERLLHKDLFNLYGGMSGEATNVCTAHRCRAVWLAADQLLDDRGHYLRRGVCG